jgi:apolipoprotein D and lipocalin family protein
MKKALLLVMLSLLVGCQAAAIAPRTVERVDLDRYAGKWYEIARLPIWVENDCVGVTAEYTPRPDGKLTVLNASWVGKLDGQRKSIKGLARVMNQPVNSKLKVMFFWPWEGDYWIFQLDASYRWAAVGSPDRATLWVLSRTPEMDEKLYQEILEKLKGDGFPVEKLEKTLQK